MAIATTKRACWSEKKLTTTSHAFAVDNHNMLFSHAGTTAESQVASHSGGRRAVTGKVLIWSTVALLASVVPAAPAASTRSSQPRHSALVAEVPAGQPVPVTRPYPAAEQGIVPPANPPANIAPSPDFFDSCSGATYDDSPACVNATVSAIDHARAQEGLPGMDLPTNWYQLTPQEQLFVATNLERTVRGLPPLAAMASGLDQAAALGASGGADPVPPSGYPWTMWGSNWGGAIANPLEVIYLWMYDDGPGSSNVDCPTAGASGCWGHRDNVLLNLACQECLMGTGFDATGWEGYPAWAELLVDTSGTHDLVFSWDQELASIPGAPGGAGLLAPAIAMVAVPGGGGYWMAAADGGVFTFGDAPFYQSMAGQALAAPIVGMAATPDGKGYWLVASDGGIFAFGDAGYYGSMGGHLLNKPIVGMAATPDGKGYWLVASDGGIFAFGDAPFEGSTGAIALAKPIVGMAATPAGTGYWLVASDGGIFAFGDAPYRGSTGGEPLPAPMVAMAAPSTAGYWEATANGSVYSFDVPFHGSMG